jgi:hypothetical protein
LPRRASSLTRSAPVPNQGQHRFVWLISLHNFRLSQVMNASYLSRTLWTGAFVASTLAHDFRRTYESRQAAGRPHSAANG